ncbi:hypothetical protein JCM10213v2_007430 [Rhodosporidiobolus nylandii]
MSAFPTSTPPWSAWRLDPPSSTPPDSQTLPKDLPRLPVPALDDTLARLSSSAAVLASNDEQRRALERKVEEFRGGTGQVLQAKLEKRSEDPTVQNWLAQWWDEQAYMTYRESVVCNVSYYFGFSRLPQAPSSTTNPPVSDPAYVAASIAKTALEFRRLITEGLLEPDKIGKDVLCMESYKWAFNACRIPASPSDYAVKTAEADPSAQHFVVVRKNRFFSVPVLDAEGKEYGVEQLKSSIERVVKQADKEEKAPAVGVLTGINRDRWAEAHSHLSTLSINAASLRALETAAFVICLDESAPSEIVDFSKRLWMGMDEGGNRWWDKPLQWIVFANGEAGFVGEHSCMDGTPTARLNDFLSKRLLTGEPFPPPSFSSVPPTPKPLPFELDEKALAAVSAAKVEFSNHIEPYEVHYLSYTRYGKDGIKKAGVSPDGWVQMTFQLAYYMTFNRPTATYEAAQTRRFQLGRTETVRILTPEALAFVRSALSPSSSRDEKLSLFRAAIASHGRDMKLASSGQGVDRHLFGLKMLAAELSEEERNSALEDGLLGDELVRESGTWKMSTSQIYIRHSPSYGWGPVVVDGFGLPYMIHPESLQLTVTCRKELPGAEFLKNWEQAADLVMELHEEAANEGGAKL